MSFDDYVGWDEPALVQWHPDGYRLVTNVGTNGLALLDRAVIVGQVYPDQTRDGGVSICVGRRAAVHRHRAPVRHRAR